MITLTYEQVRAMRPCEAGLAKASRLLGWPSDRAVSVRDAIEADVDLYDVLLILGRLSDPDVDRRLRLFAADCAARVLPIYEREHDSPAPRNAIIVARRYARGEATDRERGAAEAAADAAEAAAWDATGATAATAWATAATAWAAVDAARSAWVAAWVAVRSARAAWDDDTTWQRTRLIERFEGEPEDWPLEELK